MKRLIFVLISIIIAVHAGPAKNLIRAGLRHPIEPPPPNASPLPLQPMIDTASPGDTIRLAPGLYAGPITITKPIVLDGQYMATIDAGGRGSVIYLKTDSAHIKNLRLQNSGSSHDQLDAGIQIRGNYNIIENVRIENCLFGMDLQNVEHNLIVNNEISSKEELPLAIKGDAIRLWYSRYNKVISNYWHDVRDMVVWYSLFNFFQGNLGIGNRYSIHFMYSHNNRIQNNEFHNNSVGVFLMYSAATIMINNTITGSNRPDAMCLGMKETSSNEIIGNRFLYSSVGVYIDHSPFEEFKTNIFERNEIAFCNVGVQFHSELEGNVFRFNIFKDNLSQVAVRGNTANDNVWEYNCWDDFQGFDRDDDNIGDTPYVLLEYVEHLWDNKPEVRFFFGTPVLALLDFLEKLAPFTPPRLILEDPYPVYYCKDIKNITRFSETVVEKNASSK